MASEDHGTGVTLQFHLYAAVTRQSTLGRERKEDKSIATKVDRRAPTSGSDGIVSIQFTLKE